MATINLVNTKCPLCKSDNSRFLFKSKDREHPISGTFPIVQCKHCKLVYLNPRPDNDSLSACYPDDYDSYAFGVGAVGGLQKILRRRTAGRIAGFLSENSRLLEIGCATGDLLVPLREHAGLDVIGVELSPYAAEIATQRHGLDVRVGTLDSVSLPKEHFDAVVMRNVLEHLPAPLDDLISVADLLKDGGYIFIDVPNYDSLDRCLFGPYWYGYSSPRHLTIPSAKTLKDMLRRAGFSCVEVNHSMVPNNWIGSLKNILDDLAGEQNRFRWINFRNPFFVAIAAPLGLLQKVFRCSGRIEVVARKVA